MKVKSMPTDRFRFTRSTLVLSVIATGMVSMQSPEAAAAAPEAHVTSASQELSIKLGSTGSGRTWRGSIGDVIEITYKKRGKNEVFEGRLESYREISRNLATMTVQGTGSDDQSSRTFIIGDIVKIETITPASDQPETVATSTDQGSTGSNQASSAANDSTPAPATSHAWGFPTSPGENEANLPKIFLLPIQGGVGDGTRHNEMQQIGEIADKYGPGQIIVLKVNSPGGLVAEADLIHETLMDLKKRHRLIAWVEEAISAAAFTSLHCNEIYFMKTGALGSATMFAGGKAIEGEQLRQWVKKFGDVAEESGHPRALAESMCTNSEMCSYDPADGETGPVVYHTMEGEVPLSTDEENLTINAHDAVACGLADGIADNEEELAELLLLPRWYETTDEGRKIHKSWQKQL